MKMTEQDIAVSYKELRNRLYFASNIKSYYADIAELRTGLIKILVGHIGPDALYAALEVLCSDRNKDQS